MTRELQRGLVLTHVNGLKVAGMGVPAVNSTIREAVISNTRPVEMTFKHPADRDKAPVEAASLPPKSLTPKITKEDKVLK